jgi:peroxin-14
MATMSSENKTMQNAITFLKDPRVVNSPLSRRVNFLKSKGLSIEEIHEAFRLAGQEMDIEKIKNIVNVQPTTQPAAQTKTGPAAAPVQQQQQQAPPVPPRPQYAPVPPQYAPPPPPPPPQTTWKDYFIGATVGTLAIVGAVNLTKSYCPFEVKMKGATPSAPTTAAPPPPLTQQAPTPNSQEVVKDLQQQLDTAKTSLAKAEEELTKLRRERVDMQSAAAKTRGEIQQHARKADTLTAENTRLLLEIETLRAAASQAPALVGGDTVTTTGAPLETVKPEGALVPQDEPAN